MFCGGGLMAVGLRSAGYALTWANDFDKNAAKAYAHNIGDHVICGDITSDSVQSTIPDADIFAGGPPCQDFSVAGNGAGEDGERGKLVWTYLSIIERKQPKAFVFENVKGLIQRKHRGTLDALLERFDAIGYNVSWRLINAWDYGVAQKRERVFIVGIRKDIGFTFQFPEPDAESCRTQVLRDVIGDLPEPTNTGKNPQDGRYSSPRDASIHPGDGTVSMNIVRNHVQTRATTVKPDNRLSFQRSYVANMDGPGRTVNTSRLDHAEIHPSKPRRFTVRECLRIQSVPDTYVIPPDVSLSAAYRIVGNGVASRVSYVIGVALATQLNEKITEVSA